MKDRIHFFIVVLLLLSRPPIYAQTNSVNVNLNSIWILENEKFEGYQTYEYFYKNTIYRFECKNNQLSKTENYYINDLFFLSDSTFDLFSMDIRDEELAQFFNDKKNRQLLLKDIKIDFNKDIKMVYAIHVNQEKGKITLAHLYSYQFYNKNTFNQYGYGWTPGQPQIGYIFNLAVNVPENVMIEIQKIDKDKFKTISKTKSIIYNKPGKKTKTYLVRGDIIEKLDNVREDIRSLQWLHVRYYGKRTIEGWIKKSDVE